MFKSKNKLLFIFFLCSVSILYAKSTRKYRSYEECDLSENYKSFTMDKTGSIVSAIETELFSKPTYSKVWELSKPDSGVYFTYYFYDVDGENLCLGLTASNSLQSEAAVYVNTEKECGSECKVFLDKPEEKQIYYVWAPLKEVITDKSKEKIVIKTDKKTYMIYVRQGITKLELFAPGFIKVKSIKGLEKLPNLTYFTLIGFDY